MKISAYMIVKGIRYLKNYGLKEFCKNVIDDLNKKYLIKNGGTDIVLKLLN